MSSGDGGGQGFAVVTVDDDVGRGLFATRTFSSGETILTETPVVSCQHAWNASYGYSACHLCLAPLETAEQNARRLSDNPGILLPNSECCQTRPNFHVECESCPVKYCSDQCRREAWDRFHKTLCYGSKRVDPHHPLLRLMQVWKTLHYPPETTSVEMVLRILASIVQAQDPDEQTAKYMSFIHDTKHLSSKGSLYTHKLLGDTFAAQLEQLRVGTAEVFSAHPVVQHLLLPDAFSSLFALLGRNAQGLATSPFSVWVRGVERLRPGHKEKATVDKLIDELYAAFDNHVGTFLDNEGSGLYELQSSINHSCSPNAEVAYPFNSHRCVVNALRRIDPGEQIFISYLDPPDVERSRHSRRKMLRENYLFDCGCPRCEAQVGDPDETSEEEMEEDDEEEEEAKAEAEAETEGQEEVEEESDK